MHTGHARMLTLLETVITGHTVAVAADDRELRLTPLERDFDGYPPGPLSLPLAEITYGYHMPGGLALAFERDKLVKTVTPIDRGDVDAIIGYVSRRFSLPTNARSIAAAELKTLAKRELVTVEGRFEPNHAEMSNFEGVMISVPGTIPGGTRLRVTGFFSPASDARYLTAGYNDAGLDVIAIEPFGVWYAGGSLCIRSHDETTVVFEPGQDFGASALEAALYVPIGAVTDISMTRGTHDRTRAELRVAGAFDLAPCDELVISNVSAVDAGAIVATLRRAFALPLHPSPITPTDALRLAQGQFIIVDGRYTGESYADFEHAIHLVRRDRSLVHGQLYRVTGFYVPGRTGTGLYDHVPRLRVVALEPLT